MQRKLPGIINKDIDASGQLLIVYSAFVKYLRKNTNTMKQCIVYLHASKKAYGSVWREILYNILVEFGIHMKLVRLLKCGLFDRASSSSNNLIAVHGTVRTVHTTYGAALKTTTHPKTQCTKPYAAAQHLMSLMIGVCTRNMSS